MTALASTTTRSPTADVSLRQERTAVLGMTLFIASWAMLFAALFFAYALIRLRTPAWPPLDLPVIPRLLPTLASLVLGASSYTVERALRGARLGQPPARLVTATVLLGLLFLGLQAVVWRELFRGGLLPRSGTYASVFYGLTVFHALHVIVGVVGMGIVAMRAPGRAVTDVIPLRLWTLYWHMVGVIWGVMFVLVYLV